jgi:pyruvate formate lyase activating enzyme
MAERADLAGLVFDIREFTVHDGPGIRTTVFLKGCPLRCAWCHNPEGQSPEPQLMVYPDKCRHCGLCRSVCRHAPCAVCGACVQICPAAARRLCGRIYRVDELVAILRRHQDIYRLSGGGVTLSGGEPLAQPQFCLAVARKLREAGIHVALDTCGYCAASMFASALAVVDLVLFDLKLARPEAHRRWTGRDNALIVANLRLLAGLGVPYRLRIPLIPGVNDTPAEVEAMAQLVASLPVQPPIDILPYHRTAGAKYGALGRQYQPGFDVTAVPDPRLEIWHRHQLEVNVQ